MSKESKRLDSRLAADRGVALVEAKQKADDDLAHAEAAARRELEAARARHSTTIDSVTKTAAATTATLRRELLAWWHTLAASLFLEWERADMNIATTRSIFEACGKLRDRAVAELGISHPRDASSALRVALILHFGTSRPGLLRMALDHDGINGDSVGQPCLRALEADNLLSFSAELKAAATALVEHYFGKDGTPNAFELSRMQAFREEVLTDDDARRVRSAFAERAEKEGRLLAARDRDPSRAALVSRTITGPRPREFGV